MGINELNEVGTNIVKLRKQKGWSQQELAKEADISRTGLSRIESGKTDPRTKTLQAIATALGVDLSELVSAIPDLEGFRFRAFDRINTRNQIINDVRIWLDNYRHIESILGLSPNPCPKKLFSKIRENRPIDAAQALRKELNLSDEPIRNILGLLEQKIGIKVFPQSVASDKFFGLSVSEDFGGPAIVVNTWDRISVERWIFTAVHELGHLIFHFDSYGLQEVEEEEEAEIEANEFASHFLMPNVTFEREWKYTEGLSFLDRVFKLKRLFRVSYRTILYRLIKDFGYNKNLWMIFPSQYKKRFGRSLKGHEEPEPKAQVRDFDHYSSMLKAEEPANLRGGDFVGGRLSSLVKRALQEEKIDLQEGSKILGISSEKMNSLFSDWSALEELQPPSS